MISRRLLQLLVLLAQVIENLDLAHRDVGVDEVVSDEGVSILSQQQLIFLEQLIDNLG